MLYNTNLRMQLTLLLVGMFLYAKLVMENLLAQPNREKFREETRLERLPRGIGDAYVPGWLLQCHCANSKLVIPGSSKGPSRKPLNSKPINY